MASGFFEPSYLLYSIPDLRMSEPNHQSALQRASAFCRSNSLVLGCVGIVVLGHVGWRWIQKQPDIMKGGGKRYPWTEVRMEGGGGLARASISKRSLFPDETFKLTSVTNLRSGIPMTCSITC